MISYSHFTVRTAVIVAFAGLVLSARITAQAPSSGSSVKIRYVPITYTSPGDGQKMYDHYCAVCHGEDGGGNGVAAPAVSSPPIDLTVVSETRLRNILNDHISWRSHEKAGMPFWYDQFRAIDRGTSSSLSDMRVAALVGYVKKLQTSRAPVTVSLTK